MGGEGKKREKKRESNKEAKREKEKNKEKKAFPSVLKKKGKGGK